jgi:hypothetical protein
MDIPLQAREQIPKYGIETPDVPCQKEIQISPKSTRSDHTTLEFKGINP